MTVTHASPFVVGPAEGETLWAGPISTVVKVGTEQTGGHVSITEMDVPAGFMVPPHVHAATDEWSYVVAGVIGARIGETELVASTGSWVRKPRGLLHTFWNVGPEPARIVELITPGRFEGMFRAMADLAARDELTDERLDALATEFETTIDMSWVEELQHRYGLEISL